MKALLTPLTAPLAARWQEWSDRFAALTRRERIIMAATLIVGGSFAIVTLALKPKQIQAASAARTVAVATIEVAKLQAQLTVLKAQNADPDAANRQRLAQLQGQIAEMGVRLTRFEAGMVPPSRMQVFLQNLLAKNRHIELLELKTLPVELVGAGEAEKKPADATPIPTEGIFRHGVEIRLAGSYNDLLNYLAELERMPEQVMWNSVRLEVDKYPRNELSLRVYTLSLDRNWLVI